MSSAPPTVDPGLQNERTALAWRRTALSLLVTAVTVAKVSAPQWRPVVLVWLVIGIGGAVGMLVVSSRTYQSRRADQSSVSPWPLIQLSVVTTVGVGALATYSVLV